jgi:hypothetical protein
MTDLTKACAALILVQAGKKYDSWRTVTFNFDFRDQ